MAVGVSVKGHRDYNEDYEEELSIKEDEEHNGRVILSLTTNDSSFNKKELLRVVRIMCEE